MNIDYCLEQKMIKKDPTVKNRVKKSLESSNHFLKASKKNYDINENEMVLIASYNSIFHSIRALLYNKGYTERSHYCLFIAVKELYKQEQELIRLITTADKIRTSRHNTQYNWQSIDENEAKFTIEIAERILKKVKKYLKK